MQSVRRVACVVGLVLACAAPALAQSVPPPCPTQPIRVVRSRGGVNDYVGAEPGIPDLCRIRRSDGDGAFYLGVWRADWPGAGLAYPALRRIVHAPAGTRASFVTRSWPGLQWTDSFVNEGVETVLVDGVSRPALRLAHERDGIEGNTYHSVITSWLDLATGVNLRTDERQISGQSYGPNATWHALRLEPMPPG